MSKIPLCALLSLVFFVFASICAYATFEQTYVNNTAPTRLEIVNFAVLISSPPSTLNVVFQWNATQNGTFINVSNATYTNLTTLIDKVNFSVNMSISSLPRTRIGWQFGANHPDGSFIFYPTPSGTPLTVSNIPPTAPTILMPTNDSKANRLPIYLNVTFPADAENDTISINYYINGILNQTSSGNATFNASDGFYILNISLFDGYNFSANSTANFTLDTTPPGINITNNNATIRIKDRLNISCHTFNSPATGNITFNITGTASLYSFSFALAGDSANFSQNITVNLTRANVINATCWASDSAGNIAQNSTLITVANTPPTAPIIVFPTAGLNTSKSSVELNVTFAADADNDAISIAYYINGKLNQTSSTNVTFNASHGIYILNASVSDGFSDANADAQNTTVNFTIDTIIPRIFSFNGNVASNANISQIQMMNVTASDNSTGISILIFSIGNKNFTANKNNENDWVAELDTKNFTDGFYNITALAQDFAGNGDFVGNMETSHVVISEVLFNAAGLDDGRVWVELYNPTNSSVNLSGLNIKGGTRIITLPDFVVQKKSAIVIANASNFSRDYGFSPDLDLFQGDFDFTNSNDFVQLRNASSIVIDELSWGNNNDGTYNWSLFADEGRSITRNPVSADSDEQYDWQSNTTPTPRSLVNPNFITIYIDNNTAPNSAAAIPNIKFEEDSYSQTINLSQYFSDVDNDALTFSWTTNDSNVSAVVFPNNIIKISSSLNWNGIANITIIANDGRLNANQTSIVNVTPVNDAPVIGSSISSSSSGGGGGGGGGSGLGLTFVCNMDWQCGEWSRCESGQESRQCVFTKVPQHAQSEPCSDELKQPLAKRACEIEKEQAANINNKFLSEVSEPKNKTAEQEAEAAQKTQKTQGLGAITGAAASNLKRLMSNPKTVKELKVGLLIVVISALGIFTYERVKNKMK